MKKTFCVGYKKIKKSQKKKIVFFRKIFLGMIDIIIRGPFSLKLCIYVPSFICLNDLVGVSQNLRFIERV